VTGAARFLILACLLGSTNWLSSGCSDPSRTTGTLAPENEDVRKGMEASAANYLKNSPANRPAPKDQGK
jgi:hypothetical protein